MIRAETYFISVGEQSGDLLAADLVRELSHLIPSFQAKGIVGAEMVNAGVKPLARMEDINTMGFSDVLARLPQLRMFESRLLAQLDEHPPAFAVLVDFPGFHLRLAEQLRLRGIPVIQYVAPKVWAWGGSRVAKLKKDFSMVLGILPFEEEFFLKAAVPYVYCGSPHLDRVAVVNATKADLSLSDDAPTFAFLPGSRVEELRLIMPRLLRIWKSLKEAIPSAVAIMPLATSLNIEELKSVLRMSGWPHPVKATDYGWQSGAWRFYNGSSLAVMKAADAAVVASGTATLECALLGTPMTVVYQMSALSFAIAMKVLKLPYVSLVNLVAQKRVVEEYIQDFSEQEVAAELARLSVEGDGRDAMMRSFDQMRSNLKGNCAQRAAHEIVALMKPSERPHV